MKDKINILGVSIDNVTMNEAEARISQFVASPDIHTVFTPNPEIIMLANQNKKLFSILQKADLVVPDGIGVVIASKIQRGTSLGERVAGYDLVQNTMKQAVQKGYKYYFFGSKPGVAKKAAEEMRTAYPGIQIVGTNDGYFKQEETADIIADINASGANILLVALGAPKQEIWIDENKHLLKHVKVLIGVGGSLDVMAGVAKRAPLVFQKVGLEWFYRLIKEPSRIGRMMVLPQFIIEVLRYKSKQNG
ncbi:MAG: glycosyl transferase, WecB/TagA/CpsF family [Clostridia bacterium]|jgi:N-acetylglucosaminyldiphosphoundecaprenol N-acetyl-beta-D-mannosaminyltransferase|nr:glycosyl transferase, WecB/TagA/CpsF family [Clostridia bacterium]